jgi:hypothetical protein
MAAALRQREHRVKVILPARMKDHRGWHDVRILNISSKGLMARSPAAPSRGSYLELRRGSYVIVARVVWSNGQQFGLQSQSLLVPGDIIDETARAVPPAIGGRDRSAAERRASPRPAGRSHEANRGRARTLEYVGILSLAALLAAFAFDMSRQAFAHSMKAAADSLHRPGVR